MSTWSTDARPGYRSKTVQLDGCTIVIHRPLQNKQEQVKNEERVQHLLATLKLSNT